MYKRQVYISSCLTFRTDLRERDDVCLPCYSISHKALTVGASSKDGRYWVLAGAHGQCRFVFWVTLFLDTFRSGLMDLS